MRMWMCTPEILCRQHLLGSHVELHMLVDHLNKHKSITGYIENNCIEPQAISEYHNTIAIEMRERGYVHKSPLSPFHIFYLPLEEQEFKVNKKQSLKDLLNRCDNCYERYRKYNEN